MTFVVSHFPRLIAALGVSLSVAAIVSAQTTLDVLDETILLNNGTPTSQGTADAEDNFGGRGEWIIGNNNNNPRGGLLRFDVSSISDQINDAAQSVTEATLILNTADAREDIQPVTDSIFDVYIVVSENSGWFEGTQAGSRAGWSGEPGSASQLYLANPEFEPEDALSPDIVEEFDDVILWHSSNEYDGAPVPFEVGLDTQLDSIGAVSTANIDGDGYLSISLDPAAVNSVLPEWLADGDGNAGLYIFPTEGQGQWFFESNEGFEDEAVDLLLTFGAGGLLGDFDGSGTLDGPDIDSLVAETNVAEPSPTFDVNADGSVDYSDVRFWVKELKGTWIGDADLDGEFSSADLVTAFTVGKYETGEAAGWTAGDFDGDGVFSSSDFVAAFTDGGYEQGPVAATAAVPEPTALSLLALAALTLLSFRSRD